MVGYDRPFNTYFAQLYDPASDRMRSWDEPDKAFGYHPTERGLDAKEITQYGPFPVHSVHDVRRLLDEWDLDEDEIERCVRTMAVDGR